MRARIRTAALPVAIAVTGVLVAANPANAGAAPAIGAHSSGVIGTSNAAGSPFGSACDHTQTANRSEEQRTSALMAGWATSAVSAGFTDLAPAVTPAEATSGDLAVLSFAGTGITVTVSRRQVGTADATSTESRSLGSPSSGAVFSGKARLQDCAPRPADLDVAPAGMALRATAAYSGHHDASDRATYWNATTTPGSNVGRDGALFEFSEPVGAFGVWFGDLETRSPESGTIKAKAGGTATHAGGVEAIAKLFDANGDLIDTLPISPDEAGVDDTICGGDNLSTDLLGCGNQATRFISFVDTAVSVKKMLVIVGDDDSCGQSVTCDANWEFLSWAGPMLAESVNTPPVSTTSTPPTPTQPATIQPAPTEPTAIQPATTQALALSPSTTVPADNAVTTTTEADQVAAAAESSQPETKVESQTESRRNVFAGLAFTGFNAASENIVVTGALMVLAGGGFVLLTGRRRRSKSTDH